MRFESASAEKVSASVAISRSLTSAPRAAATASGWVTRSSQASVVEAVLVVLITDILVSAQLLNQLGPITPPSDQLESRTRLQWNEWAAPRNEEWMAGLPSFGDAESPQRHAGHPEKGQGLG